jgi:hypothetical protein
VSVSVPILLAVAGTGLMAVAIFVPFRGEAPNAEFESDEATAAVPLWPTLVGPTAAGCDVDARLDLIDAVASLGSPWARGHRRGLGGSDRAAGDRLARDLTAGARER